MKKVLVIGGLGYYGQKVFKVLKNVQGIELFISSRKGLHPFIQLDLCNVAHFEVVKTFDLVINCSDSLAAPPDQLMSYCLREGVDYFDMGADSQTARRLLSISIDQPQASAIIGVGIFPGLSTLFACNICKRYSTIKSLDLAIRISPLSGSGPGNCNLMTAMLSTPSFVIKNHKMIQSHPVGEEARFHFLKRGHSTANQIALPDTSLIHMSTKIPNVASHIAIVPGILRYNFKALSTLTRWTGPLRSSYLWLINRTLRFMRGVLLRNVSTSVGLTVIVQTETDQIYKDELIVNDGQKGTAMGVAIAVLLWLQKQDIPHGVHTIADLFELDMFLENWSKLSGEEISLSLHPQAE